MLKKVVKCHIFQTAYIICLWTFTWQCAFLYGVAIFSTNAVIRKNGFEFDLGFEFDKHSSIHFLHVWYVLQFNKLYLHQLSIILSIFLRKIMFVLHTTVKTDKTAKWRPAYQFARTFINPGKKNGLHEKIMMMSE